MISGTFLSTLSGVNQPWTGQQFCHNPIHHRLNLGHPSMIKTKQSQQTCDLAEWRSRRIAPSYKFERYYFQTAHLNAKYQIVTGKLSFPKLLPTPRPKFQSNECANSTKTSPKNPNFVYIWSPIDWLRLRLRVIVHFFRFAKSGWFRISSAKGATVIVFLATRNEK